MNLDRQGAGRRAEGRMRAIAIGGPAHEDDLDHLAHIVGWFSDPSQISHEAPAAPLLGRRAEAGAALGAQIARLGAECVLWAAAPDDGVLARAVLRQASEAGIPVYVVEPRGARMRPLTLDDLFAQSAPIVEDAGILAAAVAGRRVLITGGGGSIGGELARRIAMLQPARLTIVDLSEFNVFTIQRDLAATSAPYEAVLCDITDADEVQAVFQRERPEIVFHAAALKHVPLVEKQPCRGVKVNILGTQIVADACAAAGADLVFVSTDKAVQPRGVMGATKRIAGLYCRARDIGSAPHGRRSIVVRLGNVLGSAGSVSQLFAQQIEAGEPITITDPRAERYFVTIRQAAEGLLRAAAVGLAPGATAGAAYTLEMGRPVRIVDLANDMLRLAGLRPCVDGRVKFVGLRPGEKLTEVLFAENETVGRTRSAGVHMATAPLPPLTVIEAQISALAARARALDEDGVRRGLAEALLAAAQPLAQRLAV
ncbi:MAG: polysaccharide biosynthesis protein [Hyphomonadaceae bacterium]